MQVSTSNPSAPSAELQPDSFTRSVLNALGCPVLLVDRTGTIIYRNAESDHLFPVGNKIEHIVALLSIHGEPRKWEQIASEALHRDQSVPLEIQALPNVDANHVEVTAKGHAVALGHGNPQGWILVRCEKDLPFDLFADPLSVSKRRASLRKLAALVAHELNNPLDGILRYVNLAIRALADSSDAKLKSYLSESRNGLIRMTQIIGDLLAFAKDTEGEFEERTVNDVVEEALRVTTDGLEVPRIVVAVDFQTPDMPLVRGSRLYQICCNLIRNAVDAMPNGGRLLVTTAMVKDDVVIRVADTGEGLPKDPTVLFKPFYTTKPPGKGTGLGLSICKDFVEEMDGAITATPGDESGALFIVRIPATSFASTGKRRKGHSSPMG